MKKINLSILASAVLSTSIFANLNEAKITVSSATKSEQSIKDVTSNVEVITSAELEANNITTVSEALQLISGVDYTSNGGLGQTTSISLRGMSSKRTLVLIDGINYNDLTGLTGASYENIIISNVKQIEIIKGAQSGIWGANASAGVINIITKDSEEGTHGNINIGIGSFNTKIIKANVSYKTNKYYFDLSSSYLKSGGFSAQIAQNKSLDDFEDDSFKNNTYSLKSGFKINDTNKVDIKYTTIKSNTEFDGWNAPNSTLDIANTNQKFASINFNHIDSFNIVDIYTKKSVFKREYPNGWTKNYDGEINEYGIKSKIPYRNNDFLIIGLDYKDFEHKNAIDKKFNNKGFFVSNSNNFNALLGGNTIFTQSLRRDVYDKFNNKTTGKIGLKHHHKFLKGFTSSINYGTAYNVPTLYQLFDSYYGNKNLKPENTKSYDITLDYKNLKLTYFSTSIEDMIIWNNTYTNDLGKSKIKGYELSYKKALGKSFVSVNYTKLNAKDKDGKDLARRAKQTLKLGVDYFGIKKLHLNLNASYIGQRFDDSAKTKQTGKYTVANVNANYKINKKVNVYAKIDNITNKYYQTVDGYATSPRAYYAGVKIKF